MTTEAEIIHCIPITQPIGTFFVARVSAQTLLKRTVIERRGLTDDEKKNVQRRLNVERTADIASYARRDNATFPTSVIVAANSDFLHYDSNRSSLIMGREVESELITDTDSKYVGLEEEDSIGLIIDGQHRIEGLRRAAKSYGDQILDRFEIPVVFMFDMSLEDMAEVFRTINSKQRPVDPSLIIDLFGLSRQRSPRRTCHTLAIGFNEEDGSPLKDGLKMLGKRENKSEFLSQGSFAKYILPLISKDPDEDELRLMQHLELIPDRNAPLREFFIGEEDDLLAKILWNFLSAAKTVFEKEWVKEPDKHLLRKTVGFSALIKVFKSIYPGMYASEDVSEPAFQSFFEKVKANIEESPFSVGKYGSSEGEAGRMARAILLANESGS